MRQRNIGASVGEIGASGRDIGGVIEVVDEGLAHRRAVELEVAQQDVVGTWNAITWACFEYLRPAVIPDGVGHGV